FNNAGTLLKSTGTGTELLTISLNNSGTVNVQSGTLQLGGGGTDSGVFAVGSGTTLTLVAGTYTFNVGAQVNGAGTFNLAGGSSALTVIGSSTIGAASFAFSSGALTDSATLTIAAGTVFDLQNNLGVGGG